MGPMGYRRSFPNGPAGMPAMGFGGAFHGYQGPPWAYPGQFNPGWYPMAFPSMMGPGGMAGGRGAGAGGRRGGGMMHPRRMMRMQRLLHLLDNSDMSDDDQKKDEGDNVQEGAAKTPGIPRRRCLIRRLRRLAAEMDSETSENEASSNKESTKEDGNVQAQQKRQQRMRQVLQQMMNEDCKQQQKSGQARHPQCTMAAEQQGPPPFIRRIRRLVKTMEEQKNNPEETNTDGEQSGEENDVYKKKQQLSQLLQLLKKSSMAEGPVMANAWAARFHATGGIPPRLLARIQRLIKSMESGNQEKDADKTTADEAEEADPMDGAEATDNECTERKQMRQLRRLLRGAGGQAGPHHGQRMCRGPGWRRGAWAAQMNPWDMQMGCPPFIGQATGMRGPQPNMRRKMMRCARKQAIMKLLREELRKVEMKEATQNQDESTHEESPLEDWADLKNDIDNMQ